MLQIPKVLHGTLPYTDVFVSMLLSLYGAEGFVVVLSKTSTSN